MSVTATWNITLSVVADAPTRCGVTVAGGESQGQQCDAFADRTFTGTESTVFVNGASSPRVAYIVVDGNSTADSGQFTLVTALVSLPPGDVCATAPLIGTGTLTGQSLLGFGNDYHVNGFAFQGCAATTPGGNDFGDRVYRMVVPSRQRLTATVLPETPQSLAFDPVVNLVVGQCPQALECVAGVNGGFHWLPDSAVYDNFSAAPVDVFIVIDTGTNRATQTFSLTTALWPVGPPGDSCGDPSVVPIAQTTTRVAESFAGYSDNYSVAGESFCRSDSTIDRVYRVEIPPGQVMTARAIRSNTGDVLALSAVDASANCNADCLPASTVSPLGQSVVVVSNAHGANARGINLVVEAEPGPTNYTYDLAVVMAPAELGEDCQSPVVLPGSVTLSAQSLAGFTNDLGTDEWPAAACNSASTGVDRVYEVALLPAQSLTASITPGPGVNSLNLSMYFVDAAAGCFSSQTRCLAGVLTSGQPRTLSYTNTGTTSRTVWVVVDSRFLSATPPTNFDLAIQLQ